MKCKKQQVNLYFKNEVKYEIMDLMHKFSHNILDIDTNKQLIY